MPTVPFRFIGPMVVRSPNWLGDAVMAMPAVRNLKMALWRDKLIVASPEKLAPLWKICPFVDEVLVLPKPRKLFAVASAIRAKKCRSAILLPNSLRTAAEVFLAKVPQRAGYASTGRRFLLTDVIPIPPFNPHRFHHSNYFLDLVVALGGPGDTEFPALSLQGVNGGLKLPEIPDINGPQVEDENGGHARSERSIHSTKVVLCPGAEYGPAKRWGLKNFAAVGAHFQRNHGFTVQILGAPGDIETARELETELRGVGGVPESAVVNKTGGTTLEEFMAELDSARLVVCNDSGAMHLASSLGVPTVTVFGSTEPRWTGPMGAHATVLRRHVPCSPCFLRTCPLDLRCFKAITPDMAIEAGERLL